MNFEQVDVNTLLRGDTVMLKENNLVCYGKVDKIIESTSTKTFLTLSNVIYEDGSRTEKIYASIDNKQLYHTDRINESITILDGTEPFSNGVYLVNVSDKELIERNKRVDEYTEKLLAKSKELITEPLEVTKQEVFEDDNFKDEESNEADLTEREQQFQPIKITKK